MANDPLNQLTNQYYGEVLLRQENERPRLVILLLVGINSLVIGGMYWPYGHVLSVFGFVSGLLLAASVLRRWLWGELLFSLSTVVFYLLNALRVADRVVHNVANARAYGIPLWFLPAAAMLVQCWTIWRLIRLKATTHTA